MMRISISRCKKYHGWMLENRKVILELRMKFYEALMKKNTYPDWSITFNPPLSFLNTIRGVKTRVYFRKKQAE